MRAGREEAVSMAGSGEGSWAPSAGSPGDAAWRCCCAMSSPMMLCPDATGSAKWTRWDEDEGSECLGRTGATEGVRGVVYRSFDCNANRPRTAGRAGGGASHGAWRGETSGSARGQAESVFLSLCPSVCPPLTSSWCCSVISYH
jgi:hypothetical protein